MKKVSVLLCLIWIISMTFPISAQELFLPLNGGQPVAGPAANESAMIQDPQGNLCFIAVENGTLSARISFDGGETFTPMELDWGIHSFSRVRSLSTFNRTGTQWLCFFIGVENGGEDIYTLSVSNNGKLSIQADLLSNDGSTGTISQYTVQRDDFDGFAVVYNRNGSLFMRLVRSFSGIHSTFRISEDGQSVSEYSISTYDIDSRTMYFGIYKYTTDNGAAHLLSFVVDQGIITEKLLLADLPTGFNGMAVKLFFKRDDSRIITVRDGNSLVIWEQTGGLWIKKHLQTIPFDKWEYLPRFDGTTLVSLIVSSSDGMKRLYYVTDREGEPPLRELHPGRNFRHVLPLGVVSIVTLDTRDVSVFSIVDGAAFLQGVAGTAVQIYSGNDIVDLTAVEPYMGGYAVAVSTVNGLTAFRYAEHLQSVIGSAAVQYENLVPNPTGPVKFFVNTEYYMTFEQNNVWYTASEDFSRISSGNGPLTRTMRLYDKEFYSRTSDTGVYLYALLPQEGAL